MATLSDYVSGTISLTTGSVDFTGSATGWLLAAFKEGDTIIDITGATEFMGVIAEITSNTAGKLTKAWEGPNLVDAPYRMRYQADGSRVSSQARNLIELLGNGNLQAVAGLSGSANQVIMFTGPGTMTTIPKTELTSGANYDVQVNAPADRDAYDGQAEGFSVLISDMGDGRSAITSRVTATTGVWSDPAYVTGPIGDTPEVTIGTVSTGAPGTDADVTATPITGGVELDFTIPAGEGFAFEGAYSGATAYAKGDVVRDNGSSWIALQPTTGNAPPTLPTTSNAYWDLLAQKGADGAGTISSIVDGDGISINNADPTAPVVSIDINSATVKGTPVDDDELGLWDSVASAFKKLTWANLKATLKTYFDTLYTLRLGTPVVSTSGTAIDFTSIPSGVRRIKVMFSVLSTTGSSVPVVQLGDSGGIETSGYFGTGAITNAVGNAANNLSEGFRVGHNGWADTNFMSGTMILDLLDPATNTWNATGIFGLSNTGQIGFVGGSKVLSAELDRVRITTVGGTDTFDAGKVNISYEK